MRDREIVDEPNKTKQHAMLFGSNLPRIKLSKLEPILSNSALSTKFM